MQINCCSCSANIEKVANYHEVYGHNIQSTLRYDLVQNNMLCEDCIDDVLEDMTS